MNTNKKIVVSNTCICGEKHFSVKRGYTILSCGSEIDGIYFDCSECDAPLFYPMEDYARVNFLEVPFEKYKAA